MSGSYTRLIRELAEVIALVDAQRAEADAWYERQCAAAERAVDNAAQAVREAEAEVNTARSEAEAVDAEVNHLWRTLYSRLGPVAGRLDPPVPATDAEGAPAPLLDGVRVLLEQAKQRGELPSSVYPLLVLFGMLGAASTAGLAMAARMVGDRYGGDLAVGMPVIALVVTLLGPVVGLAPARLLADRHYASLDARAVGAVLTAGVVTTGVLLALTTR